MPSALGGHWLQQRLHKLPGVEGGDVFHLLPCADKEDGQVQLVANCEDDPAAGCAVELCEENAGAPYGLGKGALAWASPL